MKVGIFGGTFDPPHLGHLIAAGDAHALLRLDQVVWIPASVPPHKPTQGRTPAALRLQMVRAAVGDDSRFTVDDLELERQGPSYTVDTLRQLRARWRGVELILLLGIDALLDLPGWREPQEIARLARIAVLARGSGAVAESAFPVIGVPVTRVDISATEIRRRVQAGTSIRNWVNDSVREIVERERLYIVP